MGIRPLPSHLRTGESAAPRPLTDGLDRVMRSLGIPSTDTLSSVFTRWSEIVGEELAGRCEPVSLDRGRLVIRAADQAWASELRWLEQTLVDRCAQVLGSDVVRTVRIRV